MPRKRTIEQIQANEYRVRVIKEIVLLPGFRQNVLAQWAGITAATLSKMLCGTITLREKVWEDICLGLRQNGYAKILEETEDKIKRSTNSYYPRAQQISVRLIASSSGAQVDCSFDSNLCLAQIMKLLQISLEPVFEAKTADTTESFSEQVMS
ncbi:MAG: hypothetical protein WCO23_00850 [bacterium]